jgi:drug/metabolite transporter (DMT)-like permease
MSPSLRTGYFFAAATVFIWAGFVLLSRMAGSSALNGNDVTALRFATAAVFLFPVWWHKRLSLFDRRLFLLAITGGMGYAIAVYWSFHFSPAAHGAVLLSGVLPFFVAAVAWVVIGERPKSQIWKALLCIAAGVICLGLHSLNGLSESWPGDLLLLLGCLLWAVYTVLVRKWGFTPIETTIGVTLISALCYLPVYVFLLPKGITETPWSSIITQAVYQGVIVAIVAMLLYMQALKRLGALRVGTAMATVPAIAGTGATLILGEPFSVWLLLGLVLTSLGAWLGTR